MNEYALKKPFPLEDHLWRVDRVSKQHGKKATAVWYIDARMVMDRLDEAVGADKWSDYYTVRKGEERNWVVECTLSAGESARVDVGYGEDAKSAYSDALKRAAVKFGIGRYLYGAPSLPYLDVDEWGQFTDASNKRIREALAVYVKAIEKELKMRLDDEYGVLVSDPGVGEPDSPHQQMMARAIGLLHDTSVELPGKVVSMITYLRNKDGEDGITLMSEQATAQMVERMDRLLGDLSLTPLVLAALFGRRITTVDRPGVRAIELLTWLTEGEKNAQILGYVRQLAAILQGMKEVT